MMEQCKFKSEDDGFSCPLEAEDDNEYCYWHKEFVGKAPNQEKLNELKEQKIRYAFLKNALFIRSDLQDAYLVEANLQEAEFFLSNLCNVNLSGANLREALLHHTDLQRSNLVNVNLQEAGFFSSNLCNVNLSGANLREAILHKTNLQRSNFIGAILEGADFTRSNLQGIDFNNADLQRVNFNGANLQGSDLSYANLKGAELINVNLIRSSLCHAIFDSNSRLEGALLKRSNIHHSDIDQTKSFKDAIFFSTESLTEKEINEVIADCINTNILYRLLFKNKIVLDVDKINNVDKELVCELRGAGLIHKIELVSFNESIVVSYKNKYEVINKEIVFYDDVRTLRSDNKETIFYDHWFEKFLVRKLNLITSDIPKKINNIIFKESISAKFPLLDTIFSPIFINKKYVYKGNKVEYYKRSYNIYNKLYNFYLTNGETLKAKQAHYRKSEVYRKLLLSIGGKKNVIRAYLFDWFILKTFAGYGDQIWRPIKISALFVILIFPILFWLTSGIVVKGRDEIYWYDYLYMSITTFTGLGFLNVEPNISSSSTFVLPLIEATIVVPWPQIIVMLESVFGVMMVALIIFVITIQISR